MVICFLLAFLTPRQVDEVQLDSLGMLITDVDFNRVQVCADGSFLALSRYYAWHWNADGTLRNRLGGKGGGPGEFGYMGEARWDGTYYWLIDGETLKSSLYDADGKYLSRDSIYFRQFVTAGDRLFVLETSKWDHWRPNYPRILQEISYEVIDNRLKIRKVGEPFKKVTKRQANLMFNFKLAWVVAEENRLLVVDQLEPRIAMYDLMSKSTEAGISIEQPFNPPSVILRLRDWTEPPSAPAKGIRTQREFLRWWRSWSRINYFGAVEDDLVVGYEIPHPEDDNETLQVVQRLGKGGKPTGEPLIIDGFVMGVHDDEVKVFVEREQDQDFQYFVRSYNFSAATD